MSTSEIAKQDYTMISKEIEEIIQEFQNKELVCFLTQYYKRLQMMFDLQLKLLKAQCDSYLVRVNADLISRDAAFCQEMHELEVHTQDMQRELDELFEAEADRISNIKDECLQKKSMEILNKQIESNYDAINYLLQKSIDEIIAIKHNFLQDLADIVSEAMSQKPTNKEQFVHESGTEKFDRVGKLN